ncbi:MAG TPA: methionine--tRNA ligase, partial [Methylomirabilota bacterium]|nr:methionine--tRNA ligase [Methylomirabilota bacterium]
DRLAQLYKDAAELYGISYDRFIRTTDADHVEGVQWFVRQWIKNGDIYESTYEGLYCVSCEAFYEETDLVNGRCPIHSDRNTIERLEEKNYFFRLSKYQKALEDLYRDHPEFCEPDFRRNEVLGWIGRGLKDISVSRRGLSWGIPWPDDPQQTVYVWFDALINYVSALGGPGDARYEAFWPHVQHLIGKDILKPHAVYWPCMLKAAGLPLFQHLNVHGYWRIGGGKMSKAVGNVVEALALTDKYGNDAFRYFVMREMAFGLDADFSEEALVARLNADLANDLGNLASRASTLVVNFAGGVVPAPGAAAPEEQAVAAAFKRAVDDAGAAMDEFAFHRALAAIWEFVAVVNRYVDASAPWELKKDPAKSARLDAVLYTLAESLRGLGIVLAPFLPDAAAKIRAGLGQAGEPTLADAVWGRLAPGTRVAKIAGLFPRVEDKKPAAAAPAAGDGAARISIDEFQKVDLRVAQVLAAEAVPKSKKLLKLRVSLGAEERTILAGIAEHYAPADLVGKKVVVVANLQPAKLMGIESQGMVLAGEGGQGFGVVMPDRDLPPGSKVK